MGEQVQTTVLAEGGSSAGFGDVVGTAVSVDVECGVSQGGHDLGASAGVHGGSVFIEGDVSYPVKSVVR